MELFYFTSEPFLLFLPVTNDFNSHKQGGKKLNIISVIMRNRERAFGSEASIHSKFEPIQEDIYKLLPLKVQMGIGRKGLGPHL